MKKLNKLALGLGVTTLGVAGIAYGITSCGCNEDKEAQEQADKFEFDTNKEANINAVIGTAPLANRDAVIEKLKGVELRGEQGILKAKGDIDEETVKDVTFTVETVTFTNPEGDDGQAKATGVTTHRINSITFNVKVKKGETELGKANITINDLTKVEYKLAAKKATKEELDAQKAVYKFTNVQASLDDLKAQLEGKVKADAAEKAVSDYIKSKATTFIIVDETKKAQQIPDVTITVSAARIHQAASGQNQKIDNIKVDLTFSQKDGATSDSQTIDSGSISIEYKPA